MIDHLNKKIIILIIIIITNINFFSNAKDNIIDVPYLNQNDIVSGCEAVSATMILKYLGYNITPKRFVDKYLIKKELSITNGTMYGPDPNTAYVGNPYIGRGAKCGFGCYAQCMSRCINNYLKDDSAYEAIALTDTDIDYLIDNYITKGMPVLVWATIGMVPSKNTISWKIDYSDSEDKINKRFTWISNEHCLVLVGQDEDGYYFNDPYKNNGVKKYNKRVVKKRFEEMGKQAVVIESIIED